MSNENSFKHVSGLPGNFEPNDFTLESDGRFLIMNQVKSGFLKNKPIQTFKIPYKNILAMDIISKEELGRGDAIIGGVIGGLILGPVGAILGGLSEASSKKDYKYFIVSYLPETNSSEPRNVIFDPNPNMLISRNIAFINNALKKDYSLIQPSDMVKEYLKNQGYTKNSDGSVTL